jgi:hypothetical protein
MTPAAGTAVTLAVRRGEAAEPVAEDNGFQWRLCSIRSRPGKRRASVERISDAG